MIIQEIHQALTEIVPEDWEADVYTSIIFFLVDIVLIVVLLPIVLGGIQRRRDRKVWSAPRLLMQSNIRKSCIEIFDSMLLLDWATRSWIMYGQVQDQGRVLPAPLRGRRHTSLKNVVDRYVAHEEDWPISKFYSVIDITLLQIISEVSRTRTSVDTLSSSINERMAGPIGELLTALDEFQEATSILRSNIGFFSGEYQRETMDDTRLAAIDTELRSQLGQDLGINIEPIVPLERDIRIVRAEAITFASQVRVMISAYVHLVFHFKQLLDATDLERVDISENLELRMAPYHAWQLCSSTTQVANMFSDQLLRDISGVGWSLEETCSDFIDRNFYQLGLSFTEKFEMTAVGRENKICKTLRITPNTFNFVGSLSVLALVLSMISGLIFSNASLAFFGVSVTQAAIVVRWVAWQRHSNPVVE